MTRPTRYNDATSISLRIEKKLLAKIDAHARKLGVDRSQFINATLARNSEKNPFSPHK